MHQRNDVHNLTQPAQLGRPACYLLVPLLALLQVSHLLARATSRSLVLLDEFGKGTASNDGVGLLAALLQHYAQQPSPPLLLACTHFSELLDPGGLYCRGCTTCVVLYILRTVGWAVVLVVRHAVLGAALWGELRGAVLSVLLGGLGGCTAGRGAGCTAD